MNDALLKQQKLSTELSDVFDSMVKTIIVEVILVITLFITSLIGSLLGILSFNFFVAGALFFSIWFWLVMFFLIICSICMIIYIWKYMYINTKLHEQICICLGRTPSIIKVASTSTKKQVFKEMIIDEKNKSDAKSDNSSDSIINGKIDEDLEFLEKMKKTYTK